MNGGLVVFGVNICFHGQKREVDCIPVAADGKLKRRVLRGSRDD
jgi:hypothetical protein